MTYKVFKLIGGNACHWPTGHPHPIKTMAMNYIQGPLRAVDVLDILAWEDSRARDRAMDSGRHATDAYYGAWNWLGAVILNNPRPELPWHSLQALKRVQQTREHRLQSDR